AGGGRTCRTPTSGLPRHGRPRRLPAARGTSSAAPSTGSASPRAGTTPGRASRRRSPPSPGGSGARRGTSPRPSASARPRAGRARGGVSADRGREAALGLARWAADLDRDLQRACRIAGGVRALWDAGARELGAILRVEPDRLARLIARRAAFDPGVEEARLAD